MNATLPCTEAARLDALRRYDILDSIPEIAFDDFVHLAAHICGTPIALLSLVDESRQWFKARVGLEVCQTSRDVSFCAHAMCHSDLFIVPDATADPRFADNALVTGDPHIRFYAGAPLITTDGHGLGSLCVIDRTPRALTAAQQEALQALARQVMAQLELRANLEERARAEQALREAQALSAAVLERRVQERTEQLRRAEAKYRDIVENAIEGVFQTTPDGHYLSANLALARLYGYEATEEMTEELRASSLYVDPRKREEFAALMREHDFVSGFEAQVRRRDGRVLWISEHARAVRSAQGELLCYEGTVADITERKHAEEALGASEERLRTVVTGAPLILFAVDADGFFTFSDGRGLKALGLTPGQVVGCSVFDVYRGHEDLLGTIRRVLAGETVKSVLEVGGFVFETLLSPQWDAIGAVTGAIGVSVDVTERRWAEQEIMSLNAKLEQRLGRIELLNRELSQAYDATIEGWSRALDLRDHETEGHSRRVTDLTVRLAEAFGISGDDLVHVRRGALLHDIGKMGVPDAVLLKPGPLTDDEWAVMRRHPSYAHEMLSPVEFLRPALDIPFGHHEKWDGTGYPQGLAGEDIPLAARLFAVVDVWDALRSDRPYRRAWDAERTRGHIMALAGTHFDPQVVAVFLTLVAAEEEHAPPLLLAA